MNEGTHSKLMPVCTLTTAVASSSSASKTPEEYKTVARIKEEDGVSDLFVKLEPKDEDKTGDIEPIEHLQIKEDKTGIIGRSQIELQRFINGNPCTVSDLTGKNTRVFSTKKVECIFCHCAYSSQDNYNSHMARSHTYFRNRCLVCGSKQRLIGKRIIDGKSHLHYDRYLCLLCPNKKISELETLEMHLLDHVKKIKYSTVCIMCSKKLYNSDQALHHLRSEHYLSNSTQVSDNGGIRVPKEITGPTIKQEK